MCVCVCVCVHNQYSFLETIDSDCKPESCVHVYVRTHKTIETSVHFIFMSPLIAHCAKKWSDTMCEKGVGAIILATLHYCYLDVT